MNPTRRDFLKNASASAAAIGFPAILRAANPNSTLQIASIGADGMAYSDIKSTADHAKVKYVAFCDVDKARFAKVEKDFPGTPRKIVRGDASALHDEDSPSGTVNARNSALRAGIP